MSDLNIPDEMAKTTTRTKLVTLLAKNISQMASAKNKDLFGKVIMAINNI